MYLQLYPVPCIHLPTFKKELYHLVELGVLFHQNESEWDSPTFIVPKKYGQVIWISNLCQLNKFIRHKKYPLPIITDVLRRCIGYKLFKKLEIGIQYYTFEHDKESYYLCTICKPFGMYKYDRHPMGIKCSPEFSQLEMENVLS